MRNYPSISPRSIAPSWGMPDQNLFRPQLETDTTRQLSCDVVFGSPSADCMGTGVCRISARSKGTQIAQASKRNCSSTVGLLFPIEGGKGVTMVLTHAMLCTRLYRKHLRQGILQLDCPCPLPKEVSQTLGLKFNELPIGEYQIQKAEGFLRIDFYATKFK